MAPAGSQRHGRCLYNYVAALEDLTVHGPLRATGLPLTWSLRAPIRRLCWLLEFSQHSRSSRLGASDGRRACRQRRQRRRQWRQQGAHPCR